VDGILKIHFRAFHDGVGTEIEELGYEVFDYQNLFYVDFKAEPYKHVKYGQGGPKDCIDVLMVIEFLKANCAHLKLNDNEELLGYSLLEYSVEHEKDDNNEWETIPTFKVKDEAVMTRCYNSIGDFMNRYNELV